ncbi:hypothetical protein N9L68_04125 [bacterium]|nr:hypothetical protein [bacterium]
MEKTIVHQQVRGAEEMRLVACESTSGMNHHPGFEGISPATLFFGQRVKLYSEFLKDGRVVSYHPDVEDVGSRLAKRLKVREISHHLVAMTAAKELVRTAFAARSRALRSADIGQKIFFHRNDRDNKYRAGRSEFVGPATVFGKQPRRSKLFVPGQRFGYHKSCKAFGT